MRFHKVTILGVGLIGASVALAMKKHGLCSEIIGCGRREDNLRRAQEKHMIDSFETDPLRACDGSDLVVLATPVGSFLDLVKKICGSLKKSALVTDVGSVKGNLVHDIDALMPDGICFVGGHPIAGSDRSGIDTATADLFRGTLCIITPTEKTDKDALEAVIGIWSAFGSRIKQINPDEHDRIYAAVSHLPHLIAYELVNAVADMDSSYLAFTGQGFKDTTRIALSSPELWKDICLLNRKNLIESIEILKNNLDRASRYLRASDSEALEEDFRRARTLREGIGQN
jgi:prephenate dehydrogenase